MSGNIYLNFELTLDPATTDTSGMARLLNEKIRYWNQHTNFNPRYKLLVAEAEKYIASGLPNLREQADEARRIKWKELQDKIRIARRAGINEAVAQKLVQRFAAFFTEETVLKELGQYQIRPSVFSPELNVPPKPESLQCEKLVSFSDMQAITEDLRFIHGGKYKNLYDLLRLPQTASTEQLYFAATAAADKIDKMPKSHPEADPLNRLSGRFLLYFKDDVYRRGYDVALRRLPFDILAAEVFDFYAESFRSNQKSNEQLWQESVQRTVEFRFTRAEAEYLVYEFYCLTRKCPPPTPLASATPPVPKRNTERNTFEKSKLSPLWILPVLLAVIIIAVFFRIIDSNRITELKERQKQIQQRMTTAEEKVTKLEEELQESKATAEQEKKSRLSAEEKVTELESAAEKAEQYKWDVNINRVAGNCQVLMIRGVEYRFHWCPSGEFLMGSPESEPDRYDKETQHCVTLRRGFWMGETAVTQEQWEAVIGKNPSKFKGATLPVEQVSWDECQEFIGKLNGLNVAPSGFKFSLPTEAQWEYACRAGTTTPYCFGKDWEQLEQYAWFSGHKNYEEWKASKEYKNKTYSKWGYTTHSVGTKRANAWGLYDMHGNVWEWCSDWYGDYPTGSVTDPTGGNSGSGRVFRGGGWYYYAQCCRSAFRNDDDPSYRHDSLGLRLSLVSENSIALNEKPVRKDVEQKEEVVVTPPEPVSEPLVVPPLPSEPSFSGSKAGDPLELTVKGVKWRFRFCPSGEFLMGSPESEPNRYANETQHRVTLTRGFLMGETEVTQEQWEAVWGSNPSRFKGAKLPVEKISWDDCEKFIGKLNGLGVAPSGFMFSLPTEAQWEYACRAGTTTPFSFGGVLNGDKANCNGNYPYGTATKGKYLEKTTEAGSYPVNAWGLYDMHGNVWEWCSDWYGDYPTESVTDPTGANSGSYRVGRGGGWYYYAQSCRSADRGFSVPSNRSFSLGLRLSLVSESK